MGDQRHEGVVIEIGGITQTGTGAINRLVDPFGIYLVVVSQGYVGIQRVLM
ncbi:MAG: hypothetical protein V2J25_01575 [Desulfatiglans sp.]|nr:hypothetical protein [Desulfatiglans sp.]